jgi:CheY-like chemotaxis protein
METRCLFRLPSYLRRVNEPLALLLCERGLIATQLAQRLEGLRYRLVTISNPAELIPFAESQRPMVVLVDVDGLPTPVISAVEELRAHTTTAHIPVVAFARETDDSVQAALVGKGATVVVNEAAILSHLPQLLDRALDVL